MSTPYDGALSHFSLSFVLFPPTDFTSLTLSLSFQSLLSSYTMRFSTAVLPFSLLASLAFAYVDPLWPLSLFSLLLSQANLLSSTSQSGRLDRLCRYFCRRERRRSRDLRCRIPHRRCNSVRDCG